METDCPRLDGNSSFIPWVGGKTQSNITFIFSHLARGCNCLQIRKSLRLYLEQLVWRSECPSDWMRGKMNRRTLASTVKSPQLLEKNRVHFSANCAKSPRCIKAFWRGSRTWKKKKQLSFETRHNTSIGCVRCIKNALQYFLYLDNYTCIHACFFVFFTKTRLTWIWKYTLIKNKNIINPIWIMACAQLHIILAQVCIDPQ